MMLGEERAAVLAAQEQRRRVVVVYMTNASTSGRCLTGEEQQVLCLWIVRHTSSALPGANTVVWPERAPSGGRLGGASWIIGKRDRRVADHRWIHRGTSKPVIIQSSEHLSYHGSTERRTIDVLVMTPHPPPGNRWRCRRWQTQNE